MDEVIKYGKTLDEIEGELMFGEIPDDLSDEENIFDDEYDAANEETFGGPLNDAVDVELEDYAAQTARLRLDDPVWQNPTSSEVTTSAPEACQIPLPSFNPFANLGAGDGMQMNEPSSYLGKSIWGDGGISASSSYNIWASDYGLGSLHTSLPVESDGLGDLSSLLGDDNTQYIRENKSPNIPIRAVPAMPTTALTLEDLEKWQSTPEGLMEQFHQMRLQEPVGRPVQAPVSVPAPTVPAQIFPPMPAPITAPVPPHVQKVAPFFAQTPTAAPVPPPMPQLPKTALSLEEIERQLINETRALSISSQASQKPQTPVQVVEPLPQIPMDILAQYLNTPPPPQPMMMPPAIPPMMGQVLPPMLPRLPPLQLRFLQFVNIWITHIMQGGIHQLPPGVPPPPPFLFQLMQLYRNPHLVSQMIYQSSIPIHHQQRLPPQLPPPGTPHSPMNRFQRKQPGMPSSRTIQDLAYDSFAGYMSWKEREWLIKIQIMQCKGSGDPMVEDYYYTMWREKQIANGYVLVQKTEVKALESRSDYIERTRRMNYREMQKERATIRHKEREKERAERIPDEKRPKLSLSDKFASSLGLPSKSSTSNPRHLIDMRKPPTSGENSGPRKLTDEERKIAVAKKLRTMLIRLEGALDLLMQVDDLRNPNLPPNSKFVNLSQTEKDAEIEERITLIINELMGDDLSKLLQMSKGRTVITKTLKVAGTRDQARIIVALMSAGGLVNKKMFADIVLEILPTVYSKLSSLHPDQFELLVQALSIDTLKRQLGDCNAFIRDMMLTMFFISNKNGQNLMEWAYATKFPSLALTDMKSLVYWRKSLKVVSDEDILSFARAIKDVELKGFEHLYELIVQSI